MTTQGRWRQAPLISEVISVILSLFVRTGPPGNRCADRRMGAGATQVLDASDSVFASAHPRLDLWFSGTRAQDQRQDQGGTESLQSGLLSPTGAIAPAAGGGPLFDADLLPRTILSPSNAVSGFSGGASDDESQDGGFRAGPRTLWPRLGFEPSHLPEIQLYSKLIHRPDFVRHRSQLRQGMLVSVPRKLDALPASQRGDLHAALGEALPGST